MCMHKTPYREFWPITDEVGTKEEQQVACSECGQTRWHTVGRTVSDGAWIQLKCKRERHF